jgi:hypothetical protein
MRVSVRGRLPLALALSLAAVLVAGGCGGGGKKSSTTALQGQALGTVTKSSGCKVNAGLPDRACTPGAVLVGLDVKRLCAPGYVQHAHHVTTASKQFAYGEYGFASPTTAGYKLDLLVPRGLGGSNLRANLWPASLRPPGFVEKETLSNYLHSRVCGHKLDLTTAQKEIATDWLTAYRRVGQKALAKYRPRGA